MADIVELYEKSAKNLFSIYENDLREFHNSDTKTTEYGFFEDIDIYHLSHRPCVHIRLKMSLISTRNEKGYFIVEVDYMALNQLEQNLKYLFETFEEKFPVAMKFDV
jgi:hypothetical protein